MDDGEMRSSHFDEGKVRKEYIQMNLATQLQQARSQQFVALILDNEVTVGEFVTEPPLPWARIVQIGGVFQIAEGYPKVLNAALGKAEMRNWDEVSLHGMVRNLAEFTDALDYVIIGNNAGQGLPLAQAVPQELRATRSGIIYASGLPEQSAYERLGYQNFFRRYETSPRLLAAAEATNRPLHLYFMNSIQHNTMNYHDP
jgi:hypothetical protein